jgi:hypothetical protein
MMKIKKGTKVFVNHSRKSSFHGIAKEDFDTEKDEWYPIIALEETESNVTNRVWVQGQETPCRRGLCKIEVVKNA